MKNVIFVKTALKNYRIPFYNELYKQLHYQDVTLIVLCQKPTKKEKSKADNVSNIAEPMRLCKSISLGRINLHFIPFKYFKKSTIFVLVNSNSNISNYFVLFLKFLFRYRVCMWGHTHNHQKINPSISDLVKKFSLHFYDFYFAYTSQEKKYLLDIGVAAENIKIINNAIATEEQVQILDITQFGNVTDNEIQITYCGALYEHKRLHLLISAFERVAKQHESLSFKLNIIGNGPDRRNLELLAKGKKVKFHGYLDGIDRLRVFSETYCFVNPGLVGLGVFDGFIAAKPLIACTDALHSPEIDYLKHDYNGILASGDEKSIADAISLLLTDTDKYNRLCKNANGTLRTYNLSNMVSNTLEGLQNVSKK